MSEPQNGALARIVNLEHGVRDIWSEIKTLRDRMPSRERCSEHTEEIKAMKTTIEALRFSHLRVGLIVAGVALVAQVIIGTVIAKSVETAFDRYARQIEETK